MIALWNKALPCLRETMLRNGLALPEQPVVDARWHPCPLVTPDLQKRGSYLLFYDMPIRAVFADGDGQIRTWRLDKHRIPTLTLEKQFAAAIARLPRVADHLCDALEFPSGHPKGNVALTREVPPIAGAGVSAEMLLRDLLAISAIPTVQIRAKANEVGISWATMRRAQERLGIVATRKGFGANGGWAWKLPKALAEAAK